MNGSFRRVVGIVLIGVGLAALVTPLTPGSWLIFVGAELLGIELIFWKRIKRWLQDFRRNGSVR